MRILLTNDDGVYAQGIRTLALELEKEHEVIIVAPEDQRSAQSHSITLHKPIIIKKVKLDGIKSKAYSISGTPADCVRVGMEEIAKGRIDIVFSGINMGLNSGMDILYSGTVSAAIEGNLYKLPSVAVSAEWTKEGLNYEIAAKYASKVLAKIKKEKLLTPMVLNLNTPFNLTDDSKPIKVCKIGGPIYDYYLSENNGDGDMTLKVTGRVETTLENDTDRYFLANGYATLTPLKYDFTDFELMDKVRKCIDEDIDCE